MDEDTRNFGLEFGANEFTMTGKNLVARIENVSAKHIKYDVTTGTVTSFPCTCRCSSECFTRINFRIKCFFLNNHSKHHAGSLLATDVTFTPFATFRSVDADITVTTDKATTVRPAQNLMLWPK
jgi:hypothetical protein